MNDRTKEILDERGKTYGDYFTMSVTAQAIKELVSNGVCEPSIKPYQRESLDLIATKIARIVDGDPDHLDSWRDIAGYATLVADQLDKENP